MTPTRARWVAVSLFVAVTLIDAFAARTASVGVLHFPALVVIGRWGRKPEAIAFAFLCMVELWVFGPLGSPLTLGPTVPPMLQHVAEVVAAGISYITVVLVLSQMRQLETMSAEMARDPLTRLGNRRALTAHLAKMRDRGLPVAILVLDIDHFKRVNDTYGHAAGDLVLTELGRRFVASLRRSDAIARTGGEEFVAVLDEVDPDRAVALAERIREHVAHDPFDVPGARLPVTVSVGVAVGHADEALIARADEALYEAKRAGRNRVVLAH